MWAESTSPAFIGREGEAGGVIGVEIGLMVGETGLEGEAAKEFQARAASLPSLAWCR